LVLVQVCGVAGCIRCGRLSQIGVRKALPEPVVLPLFVNHALCDVCPVSLFIPSWVLKGRSGVATDPVC
jgi:hypothetical protein